MEAEKWEEAVGIQDFYRIWVGFYRLATGYYRINGAGNRLLPHITASYRITFFIAAKRGRNSPQSQAELGTSLGNGVLGFWSIAMPTSGSGGGFWREKLRIFTHFSAVFHDFTHRTGPYLRDFTHFYGCEPFFKYREPKREAEEGTKRRNRHLPVDSRGRFGRF
jgi:hypothetical protein